MSLRVKKGGFKSLDLSLRSEARNQTNNQLFAVGSHQGKWLPIMFVLVLRCIQLTFGWTTRVKVTQSFAKMHAFSEMPAWDSGNKLKMNSQHACTAPHRPDSAWRFLILTFTLYIYIWLTLFIQSNLYCIQGTHLHLNSSHFSWKSNPWPWCKCCSLLLEIHERLEKAKM